MKTDGQQGHSRPPVFRNKTTCHLPPPPLKSSLTKVVAEIRQLHSEVVLAARTTLERAIRIGELLTAQKATLPHGQWLPWIEQHLPFTDDTARNYMRVFERRHQIPNISEFGLADTYKLLAEPGKEKPKTATVAAPTVEAVEVNDPKSFSEAHDGTMAQLATFGERLKSTDITLKECAAIVQEAKRLVQLWTAATLECERALGDIINQAEAAGCKDELLVEVNKNLTAKRFRCTSCDAEFDDDDSAVALYECGDCGDQFTRENSADGDSNRCPGCNKFAAKLSDMGCPECGEAELEDVTAEAAA